MRFTQNCFADLYLRCDGRFLKTDPHPPPPPTPHHNPLLIVQAVMARQQTTLPSLPPPVSAHPSIGAPPPSAACALLTPFNQAKASIIKPRLGTDEPTARRSFVFRRTLVGFICFICFSANFLLMARLRIASCFASVLRFLNVT